MHGFSRIINELGGPTAVARQLRLGDNAVDKWVRRNSIPARYWPGLLDLAAEQGKSGITPESLVKSVAKATAPKRKGKAS